MKSKNLIIILLLVVFVLSLGLCYVFIKKSNNETPKINMPLTSSLIADWAALDLKNALVFKSDMNAGAIYFISADKYKAEYIFFVLSKTGTGKYEKTEKRTGSVSMRTHETQIIRNGGISLYWQPPTNLYITNGIQEASIISISEVALFNEGNFNKIEWSSVKKANR